MAFFVTGIRNERRLVTVPVAGPAGCIVTVPNDCCDGGSGSGSGSGGSPCSNACDQCIPMSGSWALTVGTDPEPIYLNRVDNPNDGNECRFVSADLVWDLYFDYESGTWFLVNYSTEDVWFLDASLWSCTETNLLTNEQDGGDNASVTPVEVCTSWNCVDGTCVEVQNTSGTYPTQAECMAACGGTIPTDCCPDDLLPSTFNVAFSDGTGDLACMDGETAVVVFNPVYEDGPGWDNTSGGVAPLWCGDDIHPFNILFQCLTGGWTAQGSYSGIATFFGTTMVFNCAPFLASVTVFSNTGASIVLTFTP